MASRIDQLNTPSFPLSGGELIEMSQYGVSVKVPFFKVRQNLWKYEDIVATTSGNTLTLTANIPSGAVEIEVMFNGVSTAASSQPPVIRLGDAGGIETTGYAGVVRGPTGETLVTTDFRPFRANAWGAADVLNGVMRLTRWDLSLNKWYAESLCIDGSNLSMFSGYKSTSQVLTSIFISTPGAATAFDAGSARVRWR